MFKLRPYQDSDLNFILKPWGRCTRQSSIGYGIEEKLFFYEHGRVMKKALEHCKDDIIIACDEHDPEVLYGVIVGKQYKPGAMLNLDIVHFVYVKDVVRKFGIASKLVESFLKHEGKQLAITLKTKSTLFRGRTIHYNPYFLINSTYMENA